MRFTHIPSDDVVSSDQSDGFQSSGFSQSDGSDDVISSDGSSYGPPGFDDDGRHDPNDGGSYIQ